jgi:hypothetical protein
MSIDVSSSCVGVRMKECKVLPEVFGGRTFSCIELRSDSGETSSTIEYSGIDVYTLLLCLPTL